MLRQASPVVFPLLVSEAGKGAGCCGMSVGSGGEVGMDLGVVNVGDRVGLSDEVRNRGGSRVWVMNVFAKEEDRGVGEWC